MKYRKKILRSSNKQSLQKNITKKLFSFTRTHSKKRGTDGNINEQEEFDDPCNVSQGVADKSIWAFNTESEAEVNNEQILD